MYSFWGLGFFFSIGLHLALVSVPSGLLWLCNVSLDLEWQTLQHCSSAQDCFGYPDSFVVLYKLYDSFFFISLNSEMGILNDIVCR